MPENFNFSKIEDQKKFENLPEKAREEVVGVAREESIKTQENFLAQNKETAPSRESILKLLKEKKWIVDDGYDYESETPPEMLPTLFHGTSRYYEDDIKNNGLNPFTEQVQLKNVFAVSSDLEIAYSRALDEGVLRTNIEKSSEHRKRVYATYNFDYAKMYRGAEIIEYGLKDIENMYGDFLPSRDEIIREIGEVDSKEKKALMSALKPEPLVVKIKAPLEIFDIEGTNTYGGNDLATRFLSDPEARRQLRINIERALEIYRQHVEEIKKFGTPKNIQMKDSGFMWEYLQDAANKIISVSEDEIFLLTVAELIEIYLRSGKHELLFKDIPKNFVEIIEDDEVSV